MSPTYIAVQFHKCILTHPPHSPDLQKILHEEECSDANKGWKLVNRSEFTEVWKKSDPLKPIHLVKVKSYTDFIIG